MEKANPESGVLLPVFEQIPNLRKQLFFRRRFRIFFGFFFFSLKPVKGLYDEEQDQGGQQEIDDCLNKHAERDAGAADR